MNLNQVTLPSLNVEASVAFYQLLGLQLIVLALPKYARLVCPEGNSTLSVHQVDELSEGHGVIIYFECQDIDDKVVQLKKNGIHFKTLPEDMSWLWREASLTDPDNNKIILYHAGENRLNPPWRLSE